MDDSRVSGAGDTPEGCGAMQRDPGQAKGVGACEPHEVKGAKCQVPHLGQCHPEYQHELGVKGLKAAC